MKLTKLDEQRNGNRRRADDLLPCREGEFALVLGTVCISDLASVKDVLARVESVEEETSSGAGDEEDDPGEEGVGFYEATFTEDCAEEAGRGGQLNEKERGRREATHPKREMRATTVKTEPATMKAILPLLLILPKSTSPICFLFSISGMCEHVVSFLCYVATGEDWYTP